MKRWNCFWIHTGIWMANGGEVYFFTKPETIVVGESRSDV
jgi:hypothetical protein